MCLYFALSIHELKGSFCSLLTSVSSHCTERALGSFLKSPSFPDANKAGSGLGRTSRPVTRKEHVVRPLQWAACWLAGLHVWLMVAGLLAALAEQLED